MGLGIWKQWKYLKKQGVPMVLMFASSGGGLVDVTEYEQFRLERPGKDGVTRPLTVGSPAISMSTAADLKLQSAL